MVPSNQNPNRKFDLGRVVITPGAMAALAEARQHPAVYLVRHERGDWGDLSAADKALNDTWVIHDNQIRMNRILSAYHTAHGAKIWIITDCGVTTILMPEEY